MGKNWLCLAVLLTVSIGCIYGTGITGTIPAGESALKRADVIKIDSMAAFGRLEKSPVEFLHDNHTRALALKDLDCTACHMTKNDRIYPKFKRFEDTDRIEVMNIYHQGCIACHGEMRLSREKTGPVDCDDCHTGKEKYLSSRQAMGFDTSLHFAHSQSADNKCEKCHHAYNETKKELFDIFDFLSIKSQALGNVPIREKDLVITDADRHIIEYIKNRITDYFTVTNIAFFQACLETGIRFVRFKKLDNCALCSAYDNYLFNVDTALNTCCQGNILASAEVVKAMSSTYENTKGDMIEKFLAVLDAAQEKGGDKRGQEAAAILIVKEKGAYDGGTDRYIDIRVDEHPTPIKELRNVFEVYDLCILNRDDPKDIVKLEGKVLSNVLKILNAEGFFKGTTKKFTPDVKDALIKWMHTNNFEVKEREDNFLFGSVYRYITKKINE